VETLKLELGGGYNPRSGYIVLDRIQGDYIIDFETDNIPFGDETVDEIFTQHMLEHIWNLTRLLNECHRVLKKGGIIEIIVPHKDNPRAYVLSHCRYFTEETFLTLELKEF
jgi:predicted SAM-dependent methyltransferase